MNRRRNTQQTQKSAAGQREDQRDQRHGEDRLQNDRTAREAIVAFGQCDEQRQNYRKRRQQRTAGRSKARMLAWDHRAQTLTASGKNSRSAEARLAFALYR